MSHTANSRLQEVNNSTQAGLWHGTNTSLTSEGSRYFRREIRIANAILDAARAEAACLCGARLVRIGVAVGEDCNIDLAVLDHALKLTRCGTDFEDVDIHLTSSLRRSHCHSCGSEFFPEFASQPCPRCASSDADMVEGDELELSFIEVERS